MNIKRILKYALAIFIALWVVKFVVGYLFIATLFTNGMMYAIVISYLLNFIIVVFLFSKYVGRSESKKDVHPGSVILIIAVCLLNVSIILIATLATRNHIDFNNFWQNMKGFIFNQLEFIATAIVGIAIGYRFSNSGKLIDSSINKAS